MEKIIIFKTYQATETPYAKLSVPEFIQFLKENKNDIYNGITGVYLAREIEWGSQKLYFFFIDVDGDHNLSGPDKIQSSISNAIITYRILKKLNAAQFFTIIATGGEGFRFVSNKLVNHAAYQAFIDFIKAEMPHITDTKPTEDIGMPHQLFTYKGHRNHSNKDLVDRHSVVVPAEMFEHGNFTDNDYINLTKGRSDPDIVIEFMERFLDFQPVTDLSALNGLGHILTQYQNILGKIKINPFNYLKSRKEFIPIAIEAMHEMLKEQGIYCVVAERGRMAISFQGLRCPACNSTSGNAAAYPPYYTLKCFNTACAAHRDKGGLSLSKWSNIKGIQDHQETKPESSIIQLPSQFETKEDARNIIRTELQTTDNSIIVLTPGVGKSRAALEYIAMEKAGKKVIYSSFNKALQREAYDQIHNFSQDHERFKMIQSMTDLCKKPGELNETTVKGYSPAEILCPKCEYGKTECAYYNQFTDMSHDVYFTTHHMLQYLEKRVPDPDLIIMDENLKSGLLLEDKCTEPQMRSLYKVLSSRDYHLITTILDLGHRIGDQLSKENAYPMIINTRKFVAGDLMEDTLIDLLAKYSEQTCEQIENQFKNIVSEIKQIATTNLYSEGVDLKAVNWLKGIMKEHINSYLRITAKGELLFKFKYITPLGFKDTPLKVLDGTGNSRVANTLTAREIKEVNADVEWKSNRVHFITNTSRQTMRRSKDKDLKRLLTDMLKETSAEKIMIYTYKKLKKRAVKICKEIDNSRKYMGYYFQGPRGINVFKECDAVLVIGLPYANINAAGHDAFVLFPNKEDEDIRNEWVNINMEWELIQGIHRIRPVNKDSVDIIIAAKLWPELLPEPNKKYDRSQSKNWKTAAIAALEPFVREFGFLNQDLAFIANVFVKSRASIAKEFQRKIIQVLRANCPEEVNDFTSPFSLGEEDNANQDIYKENEPGNGKGQLEDHKPKDKYISVLYNILYKNILKPENILPVKISKCLSQSSCNNGYVHPVIFSQGNQWAEILSHFQEQYKHFEKFKIKLPHARGNFVPGVGSKNQVLDFYKQINSYELFGKIKTESYITTEKSVKSVAVIPKNYEVVYFTDDIGGTFHIGSGKYMISISPQINKVEFEKLIGRALLQNKTLITNDGKLLAKTILGVDPEYGDLCHQIKIEDVILNQKIIKSGCVDYKLMTLRSINNEYDLSGDPDIALGLVQLHKICIKQHRQIHQLLLTGIHELESRLIWVTAKIEMTGMGLDAASMQKYYDELVKEDLDSNEIKDIERYLGLYNNEDGRIRDEINQLATKTGRFDRKLHRVKKSGPMRSFFIAPPGYKLIRADYSAFEVRIIAWLAKEKGLIDLFQAGKDVYNEVAGMIFVDSDIQPDIQRKITKAIVVGLNNGRTEYSIQPELTKSGLSVSLQEVQAFIDQYNGLFPKLLEWREKTIRDSRANGYVTTEMGRRMHVSNLTKATSIFNFPVQGNASDGFKYALWKLDVELQGKDARVVHILHDEIIVEAKEGTAKKVAAIVKECMEKAFADILGEEVSMLAEPDIRDAWG